MNKKVKPGMPTRAQILEFLQTSPTIAGKREIAKAFGLKGHEKIALKALLKDMAEEGLIDGKKTAYHRMGGVPKVTVLRVAEIEDGEPFAIPDAWSPDDGAPPPPLVPLDLDDLVLEEATRLRPATGVRVDTTGVSAAPVRGDRAELRRLVRNLLENGARHAATAVTVGTRVEGDAVLLDVRDDGPGVDPLDAAKMAADRGVRVYNVGVGTVDGETIGFEGWSMRVRLDEDTLKAIANKTQAEYFYAGTAEDLKKVYETLSSRLTVEKKETEISALFALGAAALMLLSAGLSLLWFNRIL